MTDFFTVFSFIIFIIIIQSTADKKRYKAPVFTPHPILLLREEKGSHQRSQALYRNTKSIQHLSIMKKREMSRGETHKTEDTFHWRHEAGDTEVWRHAKLKAR
jgi:hypothetical protein